MSGIRRNYRTLTNTFFLFILTFIFLFVNPLKGNFLLFYYKNAA